MQGTPLLLVARSVTLAPLRLASIVCWGRPCGLEFSLGQPREYMALYLLTVQA